MSSFEQPEHQVLWQQLFGHETPADAKPSSDKPAPSPAAGGATADWIETPAITIGFPGNLGNLLPKVFAAHTLARKIGDCTLHNFALPEWNLNFPKADPDRYRRKVLVRTEEDFDLVYLADRVRQEKSTHIILEAPLLRQSLYESPDIYNRLLPVMSENLPRFSDDELLINIRTGDILGPVLK